MRGLALIWLAGALGLVGCLLEPPRYDGTEFTCGEPSFSCPEHYACVDRVCRLSGDSPTGADAGPSGASPTDGGVATDPALDAAPRPYTSVTVSGAEVTFDTYIRETSPNANYGAANRVAVDADPVKVGLLRFDLSSIPSGAQIISAEMVLRFPDPIEDGEFVVHTLLEQWSESDVNWIERTDGVAWTAPGAGVGSHAVSRLFTFAPRTAGTYTIPMPAAAVQDWVADPQSNFGMRWMSNSAMGRGGGFDSSEIDTAQTDAPRITVQYR